MLTVKNLQKTFHTGKTDGLTVLSDISFTLGDGERLALSGASGVGKSTVARILTGLETPDGGNVFLDGEPLWSEGRHRKYDREKGRGIQMIFQSPYASLDPVQTIGGAVAEALVFSHSAKRGREAKEKTEELFGLVGLPFGLAKRRPFALSGGQAQRVAIARAMVNDPDVILADEPTGNLDVHNSMEIMELLEEINRRGTTVLVVTHSREIVAEMGKRVITLTRGVLTGDQKGGIWHEN